MTVAFALIVLLGVGLPVSGWLLTRRKKFGTRSWPAWLDNHDDLELDQWLTDHYQLGAEDRDRVRAAIMRGTEVPSRLDAPVRGFAAAAAAGQFRAVRRARRAVLLYGAVAAAYVILITVAITRPHTLALWFAAEGLFAAAMIISLSHRYRWSNVPVWPVRVRRNAERALTAAARASR